MGDATVNGDMPHSAFLSHVSSYPIVSDGISTFKSNPYGARSIEVTNTGYAKFVKPTFPYLETPASYAKPYVVKADELGDAFLTKFDEKVPVLKSETNELKGTVTSYIYWPITKAGETRDWIFSTYKEEYKQCGGDGFVAGTKAAFTAPLLLTSETLQWISSFLQVKKDEAKEIVQEKTSK